MNYILKMEYQLLKELSIAYFDSSINDNEYPNIKWSELKLDRNDKKSIMIEISNELTKMKHPLSKYFCCMMMMYLMKNEYVYKWIEIMIKKISENPYEIDVNDEDFIDFFSLNK
jgi:hypothetical protein